MTITDVRVRKIAKEGKMKAIVSITVIAAGWWGKIKTVCQMFMVILLICDFGGSTVHIIENVLIYLALALTIISLIDYLVKNKNVLSETK